MKCPHYVDAQTAGTSSMCLAGFVPTEPTWSEEAGFCGTRSYAQCPRYQSIASDLCLAIHREVARAIG